MNWPTNARNHEPIDDVAPGVSRVRPAAFRSLHPAARPDQKTQERKSLLAHATAQETVFANTQGPSALRAYRPAATPPAFDLPGFGAGRPDAGARRDAPRGGAAQQMEQHLAPLRGISRELVSRGMPATLAAELLSEIVVEYGNQVLASERDARLALVEQLLERIPSAPFGGAEGAPLTGSILVTGPAGAGKSVFIAYLALAAAQAGRRDVVLVNTAGERIGAAAQMNALGQVFGYAVEHAYLPQELRALRERLGSGALLLVETAGWSPREGAESARPWRWQLPGATVAVCVPATGQADDLLAMLSATREAANDAVAALCKTSETRNVLPALGALAMQRQPLGMIVPGPNLAAEAAPLELIEVARSALGVVIPQRKKGRVR